jgi:hypothetical protein
VQSIPFEVASALCWSENFEKLHQYKEARCRRLDKMYALVPQQQAHTVPQQAVQQQTHTVQQHEQLQYQQRLSQQSLMQQAAMLQQQQPIYHPGLLAAMPQVD